MDIKKSTDPEGSVVNTGSGVKGKAHKSRTEKKDKNKSESPSSNLNKIELTDPSDRENSFVDHLLENAKAQIVDAEIREKVLGMRSSFEKLFDVAQIEKKSVPFRLQKGESGLEMTLPSNILELMVHDEWKLIMSLIYANGDLRLTKSEEPFEQKNSIKEVGSFFRGLIGRFRSLDRSDENSKINLSGGKPIERGRAYVDLITLRKLSNVASLEDYIPEGVFADSPTRRSYLNYYLAQMGGSKGIKALNDLQTVIDSIVSSGVKSSASSLRPLVEAFRVPFGQVISRDLQYKEKKVKTKDSKDRKTVVSAIHLERPSESPVVLFEEEFDFLRSKETSWDQIRELAKNYEKGVALSDAENVRLEYSKYYKQQFELAAKLKGFRSSREKALNDLSTVYFSQRKNQDITYNKGNLDKIKENLAENLYNLSPTEDRVISSLFPFRQMAKFDDLPTNESSGSKTNFQEIRSLLREVKRVESRTRNLDNYFARNEMFLRWLSLNLVEEIEELLSKRWVDPSSESTQPLIPEEWELRV